jgi:glutamine cyclotransferase
LFNTDGWKIIEDRAKVILTKEYANLLCVSPKELPEHQMRIRVIRNWVMDIYNLAGLEWQWNGYENIQLNIDPKEREKQTRQT